MRNLLRNKLLISVGLVVFVMAHGLYGQKIELPETVICPTDGFVNKWASNFCIRDGTSLIEIKNKILERIKSERVTALRSAQPAFLEVGMSKVFHLRDKNIIKGKIISIEADSIAVIETAEGVLRIPAVNILEEMADLTKQDGTHFLGPILSEDDFSVSIKTPYGVVVVLKQDIRSMDRYYGDKKVSWTEQKRTFLSADEVTDIFLDPTAFPLRPNVLYVSGLSLGYGFTENFMLRTEFGRDLLGDLNLHPLFRLYHSKSGRSETALSLGVRLYNRHESRIESQKYSHWIKTSAQNQRLDEEGAPSIDEALTNPPQKLFFVSTYLVLSKKQPLSSGRGKWGWHLGLSTNSLRLHNIKLNEGFAWDNKFKIPFRVWGGMDYDISKRLKFLIEIYADNGHKYVKLSDVADGYFDFGGNPFTVDLQSGEYRPVDLDFGFTYTVNDALRLGAHFQAPYITIYWKFFEF